MLADSSPAEEWRAAHQTKGEAAVLSERFDPLLEIHLRPVLVIAARHPMRFQSRMSQRSTICIVDKLAPSYSLCQAFAGDVGVRRQSIGVRVF